MTEEPAFARRVATAVFIGLPVAALFLLVGYAANFFFLVFGGIAVGVVISALSHFVSRRTPLGYGASVGMVLLLIVGLVSGEIW